MLIGLGVLITLAMNIFNIESINLLPVLEVLGIIGLIMIVLEAALDLRLTKQKWPIIWKSGLLALVSLFLTTFFISLVFKLFLGMETINSLLYAVPLSVMSSAIIIPSVINLDEEEREFMIYESTFSDILGIMTFYFLIQSVEAETFGELSLGILGNITLTIGISLAIGYFMIYIFQNINTSVKLFLLISVLVVLYSLGKLFHLSSLLIILMFGLMLNNRHIFYPGRLKRYLNEELVREVFNNFRLITLESSFVVRTFFFVLFGMTLVLGSLLNIKVFMASVLVLALIYGVRFGVLHILIKNNRNALLFLAPRGLITILLFFAIPEEFQVEGFDTGILLYVILVTSVLMAYALIRQGRTSRDNDHGDIRVVDSHGRLLNREEILNDPGSDNQIGGGKTEEKN
jgi:Kef-type K+ transport system membrane component KefB